MADVAKPIAAGGLGFGDPRHHCMAQRAKWVALLLQPEADNTWRAGDDLSWSTLPTYFLRGLSEGTGKGLGALLEEPNLGAMVERHGADIPTEWRGTLRCWSEVRQHMVLDDPATHDEVLSAHLFRNPSLLDPTGATHHSAEWDTWATAGCTQIGDIWDAGEASASALTARK